MDKFLNNLIRRMRSERCPDRVLEEVQRAIAADGRRAISARRLRAGFALTTASIIICLALLIFWPTPAELDPSAMLVPAGTAATTNHELYAAFASIGLALQEAGNRSGTIILQETFPLFERGIETTRNAITLQNKP